MEVDHLIAETLADDAQQFSALIASLGLPNTFNVNTFANWVSACTFCNGKKGATSFKPSPLMLIVLENAEERGKACAVLAADVESDRQKSSLLSRLAKSIEQGGITEDDFRDVGAELFAKYAPVIRVLVSRTAGLHVGKEWYIIQNLWNGTAEVAGPGGVGITPIGPNPDPALKCQHCGNYGPWKGINCIQCGHSQVPDHGE